MVARRAHAMTPRNALLLHLLPPRPLSLPLPIQPQLSHRAIRRRRRRQRQDGGLEGAGRGLEEELAADLALVAHLHDEAGGHLAQALDDAGEDGVRDRLVLQVGGARAHAERAHHAELAVEAPRGVRVDGEGAARLAHVGVDELGRAAPDHGHEGADRQRQQVVGRDRGRERAQVLLAVLPRVVNLRGTSYCGLGGKVRGVAVLTPQKKCRTKMMSMRRATLWPEYRLLKGCVLPTLSRTMWSSSARSVFSEGTPLSVSTSPLKSGGLTISSMFSSPVPSAVSAASDVAFVVFPDADADMVLPPGEAEGGAIASDLTNKTE